MSSFPYFYNYTTNEKTFYPDLSTSFYDWDPNNQIKYVQKVIKENNWNESDIIIGAFQSDITYFQNNKNYYKLPKKYDETYCCCLQCKR